MTDDNLLVVPASVSKPKRNWGNPPKATIDFETRSACNLLECGSWRYSLDPSTEVMCLVFRLPHWEHGRTALWHPAFPGVGLPEATCPERRELEQWVLTGGLVEAHNAWFERGIWTNVMVPRLGWFPIRHEQWRCSAAKCASYSLPRKLEMGVMALKLLVKKDMEGHKLMKKMSKPRRPKVAEIKAWIIAHWDLQGLKSTDISIKLTPTEKAGEYLLETQWEYVPGKTMRKGVISPPGSGRTVLPIMWHEDREQLERLFQYCRTDVLAEEGLSEALRDLNPMETKVYLMDQHINEQGFQVDGEAVAAALQMVDEIYGDLNRELAEITEGKVLKATQRASMKEWFAENGLMLDDTQGATLDGWLKRADLPPKVHRCLQLVRSLGRTSTAKYVAALDWADPATWRIHGGLLYHGANTGRWCLPGEAEVLTPMGWQRIDEWQGGSIAQWHPDNSVEFLTAGRVDFPYAGEMVRIKTRSNELLCTPDHTTPVRTRGDKELQPVKAGSLQHLRSRGRKELPLSGLLKKPRGGWVDEKITRAVVMFQADGTEGLDTRTGIAYRTYRLGFTKPRKIERCRELLTALGVEFKERIEPTGLQATRFTIHASKAPEWMQAAKKFGPWLLQHNPAVFIDELKYWDGYSNERFAQVGTAYGSSSKENAQWAQTMAHLAGLKAGLRTHIFDSPNHNNYYKIYVSGAKSHGSIGLGSGCSFEREPFAGQVYCATTATGYFLVRYNGTVQVTGNSGAGLQPHNFPRGNIKDMELAWEILKTRDVALIEMMYGDVMECLSYALRGLIIPKPGRKLFIADYAAIEARVVFWLAEDEEALNIFRRGECIYCAMGSDIYGRPIIKGVDLDERQLGKQAVLGLGYQMGAPKFVDTCAKYGIHLELEFAKFVVDKYRNRFWRIKEMWWNQEAAAIEAVKRPGTSIRCGRIYWRMVDNVLHCKLPSGRLLSYVDPIVVKRPTPWGSSKDALTFMGVDSYTKKWRRQDTYGGMLVENITQAVARDLMAEAMLRCHEGDTYDVILSVHDELIAEADDGQGDVREFENLMAALPDWAEGCPVTAEGWSGYRYKK